jgi:hypothetical protein
MLAEETWVQWGSWDWHELGLVMMEKSLPRSASEEGEES